MPGLPATQRASIHCAMAASHGQRSSSSRGTPLLILAMLAGGWKLSASRNCQPSRLDSAAPMVLLPQPETPISTMTSGDCDRTCIILRPLCAAKMPSKPVSASTAEILSRLPRLHVATEALAHSREHLLGEGVILA